MYSTLGIILKRTGTGEANIYVHILTRDLGLIIATAQSARLHTSKLSSALTEYSLVSITCIKGKQGWKITDARSPHNYYFKEVSFIHVQFLLAQISVFLLKMIPGEEAHAEIFDIVRAGFDFLDSVPITTSTEFELLLVLRILYILGYVAKNSETKSFLNNMTLWNDEVLLQVMHTRKTLAFIINYALKESHL